MLIISRSGVFTLVFPILRPKANHRSFVNALYSQKTTAITSLFRTSLNVWRLILPVVYLAKTSETLYLLLRALNNSVTTCLLELNLEINHTQLYFSYLAFVTNPSDLTCCSFNSLSWSEQPLFVILPAVRETRYFLNLCSSTSKNHVCQ